MREADIRPDKLLNEYLRLSACDAVLFFGNGQGLQQRGCPGCGKQETNAAFTKSTFTYVRCCECSTLFANPSPTESTLKVFYRDSGSAKFWGEIFFPAVAEIRRVKIFNPRVRKIGELIGELDHVLERLCDVGAGSGLFLEEIGKRIPNIVLSGVEPSIKLAQDCREKGLNIFEGFSDQACRDEGWAGKADLVTSFEVIEHVSDPLCFLSSLAGLVRPGGLILFTGLCGDGFDIRILGERSKAVSPPHHLNFLSRSGVSSLLARASLEEVQFLTPGQLDVDIVRNALLADDDAVKDPELRRLLLEADEIERKRYQEGLAAKQQSSHMWVLARKRVELRK